jgi:uncharacterized protein YodC (DUF2158 family)
MTHAFAIGDVVTLHSGGRKMTVTEINDGKIVAYSWDAKGLEPQVFIFHPEALAPGDLPAAGANSEERYPVEASLEAIKGLPLDFDKAATFIRRELRRCAENCCASYDEKEGDEHVFVYFSTGGWSGAEQLMGLIEDRFDTRYHIYQWQRGGHYEFRVPIPKEAS